jgi:CPA2 family monovalent cation:H+ antiporter-2
VFLITVGMRLNLEALIEDWPMLLLALGLVLLAKIIVTSSLLYMSGSRPGVAAETGLMMASPSETTLILLGAGATAGVILPQAASFWQAVTAMGMTVTPLLATLGRAAARRVDREATAYVEAGAAAGKTVIFGFGRVGQMVADMLKSHDKGFLAVENDIDAVLAAREAGYAVLFGDVARGSMIDKLDLGSANALVLTMDDPVLIIRLARRARSQFPDLPIIARARDTDHAARLYKAGVTDAVPEAMEASLQLSEAVLVDIGVAMGPVIASIHEKRSELRGEIMEAGELEAKPRLGRRRVRDSSSSSRA